MGDISLFSITVTSNRKEIIGDALRSVLEWVDKALIVNLVDGITPPDGTLEVAHQICANKIVAVDMKIDHTTSMADMRNFGLNAATRCGATWSVQTDTDERIFTNGIDIRATLESIPRDVHTLIVLEDTGEYDKARFHRLPARGHYEQGAHEEWVTDGGKQILPHVRFHELPKTPEQNAQRSANDLHWLDIHTQAEPSKYRYSFYRAATLENLGRREEALTEYLRSLQIGNSQERAWSYYRIAGVLHNLGRHAESLKMCALGLSERMDYSELPWMAGVQCLLMGRNDEAIFWAQIAERGSWAGNLPTKLFRTGFKEPMAFFEGPYLVMESAYQNLGDKGRAQWARERADWAANERVSFARGGSNV